ncbi:HAD family hydrolase [Micromonospora sp. WMMD1082]|uniref:HAD family hydrolase n=1 Tax=Micromonospora sp. WMMD1082 TaxID=3016104 RepID=UPI0024167EF0|nr:HAD family hydrolase [Micromonospora sp. WMMD1082]MDG4796883.1 HAD family hydrolase [Micromonospora sp. WMMD1082]
MAPDRTTHVLFDFFGTLVDYSAAVNGACAATDCAALIRSYGGGLDEATFVSAWDGAYDSFKAVAVVDRREFSMAQLSRSFLADVLRREPTPAECRALVTTYTRRWNDGVRYRPDTPAIVAGLAERFGLAVVSNTHEPELVPAHIAAMGIGDHFATVVMSVEFGWRKPHPSIYTEVLDRLGIDASRAVFVGDSYEADFVGPEAAGIRAYLIDPAHAYDIPTDQRLDSLADLPARLLP